MKKTLYPKTARIADDKIRVTEKLDGSNLGFFKLNGELHIAQRNYIFARSEISADLSLYKGLAGWLDTYGDALEAELRETSAIFGEWIGMGQLKYPEDMGRFHMFAKANVSSDFEASNILYEPKLFQFPFESLEIPEFINIVKEVAVLDTIPSVKDLDTLYDEYIAEVGRPVEGFIVILTSSNIRKYVRNKRGKIEPHTYK